MKLKQKLNKTLDKSIARLKHYSPTILCCLAAVGVVGTAIASSKAATKLSKQLKDAADEKGEELSRVETCVIAVPTYLPAAAIGTGTIFCIFGSNALNKRQQAAMISAYTLVSNTYRDYRNKTKELCGEEIDQKIIDSMVLEEHKDVCLGTYGGMNAGSSLSVEESPEAIRLFYDLYSKSYFESTLAKVIQAEYHLNRNFELRGCSPLNEYYEFLGLENVYDDSLGWSMSDEIQWIDFNHRKVNLETGLECCVIEMMTEPYPLEE